MKNITPFTLYLTACYLFAFAAMAYLTQRLITSLQADIFGSMPLVGLWLAGLLFSVTIHLAHKIFVIVLIPLIGLAGLVLIF